MHWDSEKNSLVQVRQWRRWNRYGGRWDEVAMGVAGEQKGQGEGWEGWIGSARGVGLAAVVVTKS